MSAALASSVASAAPTHLVDLLRSLSAKGLDILYSSDLVTPDLAAFLAGQISRDEARKRMEVRVF